jgi:hypothetical protein
MVGRLPAVEDRHSPDSREGAIRDEEDRRIGDGEVS